MVGQFVIQLVKQFVQPFVRNIDIKKYLIIVKIYI